MNDLALSVRTARPDDAADLARIYIESWQDTYAGVISHALLAAMSRKSHTAR
ncbi:MAG: N-acetyltransferase, partial [Alphaproteobacteria bacterium]|nr:N-acetyltransferase [Alphaproteobacteria bacterium]